MEKYYPDKALKIFLSGILAGMLSLIIFLQLKQWGHETLSWVLMAGFVGMVCAAWGMSKVMRDIHEIEDDSTLTIRPDAQIEEVQAFEITPGSISFPYTTKPLQAASLAASKFWTDYDPDRPPLQKTVQSFIAERGIPIRQAAELASAIKPDNMSDVPDTSACK